MKCYIFRTSDFHDEGQLKEYDHLEDCINELKRETSEYEFIVSTKCYRTQEIGDYDYEVEIYDDYRE